MAYGHQRVIDWRRSLVSISPPVSWGKTVNRADYLLASVFKFDIPTNRFTGHLESNSTMAEKTSLVTGASGFIASHVVQQLLEKGEQVHATVRSTSNKKKISHLLEIQERWPGKLTLFEADLLVAGSFQAPMTGCSVVYHIASPFLIENKIRNGEKEVVEPALKGTQNVLDAVQRCETVNLVILTSSVAAIFGDNADVLEMKNKTLSVDYFNTTSSIRHNSYSYSKTVAEKEAWKLYKAQPNPPRWKLVTINPGLVLGPSLSQASESGSLSLLDQLLSGQLSLGVPDLWFGIVDVREVATAHIRAAEAPDSHGRYILADNRTHSFVELARILRSITRSSSIPTNKLPNILVRLSGPFLGFSQKWLKRNLGIGFDIDNHTSLSELNIVYRPLEETLADHYRSWKSAQSQLN
ncbi:Putative Flavonol reductase/cinnamoyl-CoA reductase [Penicillium brasilianum]|uniref:Putative Flavonol reductase/cinnamoyl-CoA reductase n=1 Tax=Penicillium brasilianum TaxID=104259 RepID=A0A0F7TM59_PENBI|nr:Putative Flavonol reductase/cinnamoyl-CoA reductase [Penicillium brasilianum]